MVKQFRRFKGRRFKNHQNLDDTACQELLRDVWQLSWSYKPTYGGVPPDPYLVHWQNCVNDANEFADDPDLLLSDRSVAIGLVNILRAKLDEEPAVIREHIRTTYPVTPPPPLTDEQAQAALVFATTLWLHASPDLNSSTTSLRDVIHSCVPPKTNSANISGTLPPDFCAKHLSRKGGFNIVQTEQIERHLSSHRGTIEVFCNASMLLAFQQDRQNDPFPPGFVAETLGTLDLFFRPLDGRKRRWNIRYMEKHRVDLEFGLGDYAVLDLSHYPFWHDRLAQIQSLYQEAKPSGIAQWWFDRRDRVQWATFWVALLVLGLTIVFGVISSVTGIMQVYAIYHPPR